LQFVPWRYIADWKCIGCGECCKLYSVVINFHEWLRIVKNYGIENTAPSVDKLFINRRSDGSCAFLGMDAGAYLCQLQHMKPRACQLWPFKVLTQPKFGYPDEASYNYGENRLFVYADSVCNGITIGTPNIEFAGSTVKEFVEIAAGLRINQYKTTSRPTFSQAYSNPKIIRNLRYF